MINKAWNILIILIFATCYLYILTILSPKVKSNVTLRFPSNLAELKEITKLFNLYFKVNPVYSILLFSSAYIYKQAFSIPGSVFLNLLGGALFGLAIGFPLCCLLTTTGASCCYFMSKTFGKELVEKKFPNKVLFFNQKVEENKNSLIFFLLFLRLFPMTPNWAINVISPIVGVPWSSFAFTVFLGLMPYNFITIQAGVMLSSLSSLDAILTPTTLVQLATIAFVASLPSFIFGKPFGVGWGLADRWKNEKKFA